MQDIESAAIAVLSASMSSGWGKVLEDELKVRPNLEDPASLKSAIDGLDHSHPLLQDFSLDGRSWICPSDPARSLLFHLLALPRDSQSGLPPGLSNADLDVLENYVYALGMCDALPESTDDLVLAVMAYAYRPAASSSHGRHADFVYSRTAVTRIGTLGAEFSTTDQCWKAWSGQAFRATRARVAVFICRRVQGAARQVSLLSKADGDDERTFLLPVRKMFVGAAYPGFKAVKCIEFGTHFVGDKLRRIIDVSGAQPGAGLDLDAPPFIVRSSLNARAGGQAIRDAHIELTPLSSGLILGPCPRDALVAPAYAQVNGRQVVASFIVPKRRDPLLGLFHGHGLNAGNISWNRHYTSLVVQGGKLRYAFEGALASLEHTFPQWLYPLPKLRPRPAPEFVNIRHRLREDGNIEALSDTLTGDVDFETTLDDGGFPAVLFDDGMFDGAAWARVEGTQTLPCFVVVTAPDFFPEADQADLQAWFDHNPEQSAADQFKEGGPTPLSAGRYCANLLLKEPQTGSAMFSAAENTVTAIVGRPAASARGRRNPIGLDYLRKHGSGFLSDGASGEFAPGWDVTYDELDGTYYYTTHGLGSPFPEDVKFCASANAYWPAASPDAARTFNRPHVPTAIPLLDEELGLHPLNPDAIGSAKAGWDGEFGPFFETVGGRFGVNFADIRRSDYVANSLRKTNAFGSQVFALDSADLVQRMEAMRLALPLLPVHSDNVAETPYWLVSAKQVIDAVGGFARILTLEFCIPVGEPEPRPSNPRLHPVDPGYWRLWTDAKGRAKVVLSYKNAKDVVPAKVIHSQG